MTQVENYAVANGPRATVRQAFNAVNAALRDSNSGITEPQNPVPGMWWRDMSGGGEGVLRLRNQDNDAWLTLKELMLGGATVSAPPTVHTASGTFSFPSGTLFARARLVGGGGGGGGVDGDSTNAATSAGGGGGGYVEHWFTNPTGTYTVTVGAGGAGGAGASGGAGGDGGNSTLVAGATTLTASGGKGGLGMVAASTGRRAAADGGAAAGGNTLNLSGGASGSSATISGSPIIAGNGGASLLGSGGAAGSQAAGGAGTGYGGGGGGTLVTLALSTNFNGGAGSQGVCIMEFFK